MVEPEVIEPDDKDDAQNQQQQTVDVDKPQNESTKEPPSETFVWPSDKLSDLVTETPQSQLAIIAQRPVLPPRLRALKLRTNFGAASTKTTTMTTTTMTPMSLPSSRPQRNPLRTGDGRRREGIIIKSLDGFRRVCTGSSSIVSPVTITPAISQAQMAAATSATSTATSTAATAAATTPFGAGMASAVEPGSGFPLSATKSPADSLLSRRSDERGSFQRLGPRTPHAYEDITPVTRGEWRILMASGGRARTAVVETC